VQLTAKRTDPSGRRSLTIHCGVSSVSHKAPESDAASFGLMSRTDKPSVVRNAGSPEMQGVFPRREADGRLRYYTYVIREH
jgi:hypothetical protein